MAAPKKPAITAGQTDKPVRVKRAAESASRPRAAKPQFEQPAVSAATPAPSFQQPPSLEQPLVSPSWQQPAAKSKPGVYPFWAAPGIWCYQENVYVWLDETGSVIGGASTLYGAEEGLKRYVDQLNGVAPTLDVTINLGADPLGVPGYEQLSQVLTDAYRQAAIGKGAERHADDKPFHLQPMQEIANRRGIGFILGQADKKTQEAEGMLKRGDVAAWEREIHGAIVYLAGAIINVRNKP